MNPPAKMCRQRLFRSVTRASRATLLRIILLSLCLHAASVWAALSGTKSVGPTGDYASLTAAIADVQAQTLGGALVLELQAAYVSTVETFPLTIPALNGASATNTLTIRPAIGATALSISSTNTTAATVDFNGAQFVTIDGRPGGTGSNAGSGGGTASQLTIANTNLVGVALRFINEASGNTLRYTALRSVNTWGDRGTVVFSTTTGANGNDNNNIDHCDIGDGATPPTNGIYALGTTITTSQNNSNNTVSNCNIFNFVATHVDATGVRLDAGNAVWTIAGNSFYQTVNRPALLTAAVRGIYVSKNSASNFAITANFIGGSAPGAVGTAWTTTGTNQDNRFVGIHLDVGTTTPSSVQGNTIANIVWTSSSTISALPGVWCGIFVQAGSANIGTVTGNTIGGGTGTGSVSVTTSGNGGTSFGICSASTRMVSVVNNTIGSITVNGSANTISASLCGIRFNSGVNTISNNLVGSATTANSLNAATSSTSFTGQQVTGIQVDSNSSSAVIASNTVANLNNNYVGTAATGQIRGIVTSSGVNTITGNTVRNLSTPSENADNLADSVVGISQSSTTVGQTVSQNTVHSLANTGATAAVSVIGIYFSGPTTGTNIAARNLVHSLDIASSNSSSNMVGMLFGTGTFTAVNNLMRVGLTADGTNTATAGFVGGISDRGTTAGRRFYHNSVYVGGVQTTGKSGSSALSCSGTSNTRFYVNNILVNARTKTGTASGNPAAVSYNNSGLSGLTASSNLFLASGTGGVIGRYLGTGYNTLADWQAATGQDATSLNTDPLFINPTGTVATLDLHIPANSPANNAGIAVGVMDDFDGDARSLVTPTIGADELFLPNIYVEQPAGNVLGDGVSVKDFGGVLANGGNGVAVFKITNTGTAPLTGLAVTLDGADAGDFGITQPGGTSLAPGASTNFNVSFAPTVLGARTAAIHIASNVIGAKNPFDIALTGTGQTAFGVWAIANGVSTDPGANGGANVPAFAFGMAPGASGALVFNGTFGGGGTIGALGLPSAWVESSGGGFEVRALFVRRKNAAAAGLTYSVAFSAALTNWIPNSEVPAELADDGTFQILSVPFPAAMVASGLGYFRVSVTLAP